jgi:hypothetical protein
MTAEGVQRFWGGKRGAGSFLQFCHLLRKGKLGLSVGCSAMPIHSIARRIVNKRSLAWLCMLAFAKASCEGCKRDVDSVFS